MYKLIPSRRYLNCCVTLYTVALVYFCTIHACIKMYLISISSILCILLQLLDTLICLILLHINFLISLLTILGSKFLGNTATRAKVLQKNKSNHIPYQNHRHHQRYTDFFTTRFVPNTRIIFRINTDATTCRWYWQRGTGINRRQRRF